MVRLPVTDEQFRLAEVVDRAFATQDRVLLGGLSGMVEAPLPWVPAAVARWIQELPDAGHGLGRLEHLALAAIRGGCDAPGSICASVAAADTPPHFWGDTTLWARINRPATRTADGQDPLVERLRTARSPASLLGFFPCNPGPPNDALDVAANRHQVVHVQFHLAAPELCKALSEHPAQRLFIQSAVLQSPASSHCLKLPRMASLAKAMKRCTISGSS